MDLDDFTVERDYNYPMGQLVETLAAQNVMDFTHTQGTIRESGFLWLRRQIVLGRPRRIAIGYHSEHPMSELAVFNPTQPVEYVGNPDENGSISQSSGLNSKNKSNKQVQRCIGVILSGDCKETGDPISFSIHVQPPAIHVPYEVPEMYSKILKQFKIMTAPGSHAAAIAGGLFKNETGYYLPKPQRVFDMLYLAMLQQIAGLHESHLLIDSLVVQPKMFPGTTAMYFENFTRCLRVIEDGQGEGYTPSVFWASDIYHIAPLWRERYHS